MSHLFNKGRKVIKAHCVHPEAYSTPTDTNDPFVSTKLIKGKETDDQKIKCDPAQT